MQKLKVGTKAWWAKLTPIQKKKELASAQKRKAKLSIKPKSGTKLKVGTKAWKEWQAERARWTKLTPVQKKKFLRWLDKGT